MLAGFWIRRVYEYSLWTGKPIFFLTSNWKYFFYGIFHGNKLGNIYETILSVDAYFKSIKYYLMAISKGDIKSMYDLGDLYFWDINNYYFSIRKYYQLHDCLLCISAFWWNFYEKNVRLNDCFLSKTSFAKKIQMDFWVGVRD